MTISHNSTDANIPPLIIREFLYADLDRARSLLSQRIGGVPEEDNVTEGLSKQFTLGLKSYLGYSREGKSEEYVQRSLLDAILPELEAVLESEGWLRDITDLICDESVTQEYLQDHLQPGSLVKFSADGHLFDSRYVAEQFIGFSVAGTGAIALGGETPSGISRGKGPRKPQHQPNVQPLSGHPEDLIGEFGEEAFGISSRDLKNIVRVVRGMYSSGLHLFLTTDQGWTMTARLQEGKRYLDAEREILFSRYGLSSQQWTVFGTIGQFASQSVDPPETSGLMRPDGTVDRRAMVSMLNQLLSHIASIGFSDGPIYPGFSLIPVAVYRPIPHQGFEADA